MSADRIGTTVMTHRIRPVGVDHSLASRRMLATSRSSGDVALPMLVWTAYFALTPVVWFPGLTIPRIAAIKAVLFAVAVWATWTSIDRVTLPPGVLGPLGAIGLFLSASFGFLQADSTDTLTQTLISFTLPFVVLWSFWNMPQLRGDLLRHGKVAAGLVAAISVGVVYANVFKPAALFGPNPLGYQAAWVTGFGTLSTGWSHGVALFVPFLAVAAVFGKHRRTTVLASVGIVLITAGQVIVFGRGGLVISMITVAASIAARLRTQATLLLAAATLVIVPLTVMVTDAAVPEASREPSGLSFEDVDAFSSNRLELIRQGLARIAREPVKGYGFGNDRIALRGALLQAHVTWMRMAIQGGVLFMAAWMVIAGAILIKGLRALRTAVGTDVGPAVLASVLVLVGGLVGTLVEPNSIVGSFHNAAIWWAAAGVTSRFVFDTTVRLPGQRNRHWSPGSGA